MADILDWGRASGKDETTYETTPCVKRWFQPSNRHRVKLIDWEFTLVSSSNLRSRYLRIPRLRGTFFALPSSHSMGRRFADWVSALTYSHRLQLAMVYRIQSNFIKALKNGGMHACDGRSDVVETASGVAAALGAIHWLTSRAKNAISTSRRGGGSTITRKVNAARILMGKQEVVVVRLAVPPPGEGMVRIRPQFCGVCGTDVILFNEVPGGTFASASGLFGHEISGIVESCGPGTSLQVAPGDHVIVNPLITCGIAGMTPTGDGPLEVAGEGGEADRCSQCRAGAVQCCTAATGLGMVNGSGPGGAAEMICVPEKALFKVPRGMSLQLASLCEPTAVMVHAAAKAGLAPGVRPLIIGAGSLGILGLAVAAYYGCKQATVVAKYPHQGEMAAAVAKDVGLELQVVAPHELPSAHCLDCVIVAAGGDPAMIKVASYLVPPRTRIIMVGLHLAPVALDGLILLAKELSLMGAMCYGFQVAGKPFFRDGAHQGKRSEGKPQHEFVIALSVLSRYGTAVARIQTTVVPLSDIGRVFEALSAKEAGKVVKVTIDCAA
eukprot:jgi/Mesvir1/1600/Mv14565-RA.1